jgi:hypothetical protein
MTTREEVRGSPWFNAGLPLEKPYGDTVLGSAVTSRAFDIESFARNRTWVNKGKKKYHGGKYVAPNPEPLDRHDFPPRRNWQMPPYRAPRGFGFNSSLRALLYGLSAGKNRHLRQITAVVDAYHHPTNMDSWREMENRLFQAFEQGVFLDDVQDFNKPSISDILWTAAELGAVKAVWGISNYDQLIGALSITGPVVVTLPWHQNMVTHEILASKTDRTNSPTGKSVGLVSMLITGYSANGMILHLRHLQPRWLGREIRMIDSDLVDLLSEGGQALAFERTDLSGISAPTPELYRVP